MHMRMRVAMTESREAQARSDVHAPVFFVDDVCARQLTVLDFFVLHLLSYGGRSCMIAPEEGSVQGCFTKKGGNP